MDGDMIDDVDVDVEAPTTHVEPIAEDEDAVDLDEIRESEVEDHTSSLGRPAEEGSAEAVEQDIEALIAERDQFKDIALRLQADFDNYRRRVATQQADEINRATGKFAEALLPVLDACEAAFVQHSAEIEPLYNLLLGELRKQGLEVLDLQGKEFDPVMAEAVMHEPGDEGHPVVSEVLRTGYTWKGRVLRAAMVKVRG